MSFIPDDPTTTIGFVPDSTSGFIPDEPISFRDKAKVVLGAMPFSNPVNAALSLVANIVPEDDSTLPKAKVRDVPGIVGRGVVSAELGVAKSLVGTIDAALNATPSNRALGFGAPFAPQLTKIQKTKMAKETREVTAPLREAKRRIQSAQEKFGRRYSGALAWTTRTVSEAVPYMANAWAAGVVAGPAGAATVGFVIEGDNAAEDAITSIMKNYKLTRSQVFANPEFMDQVNTERVVVGSLNAIIEAVQIGKIMKFSKSGKHSLKNFVKLARTKGMKYAGKEMKGWSGEIARLSIEEALEEFLQEDVSLSIPAIFRNEYPRKEDGSPDWLAIGERLGEATLGGAVAGPILGGVGRLAAGPGTDVAQKTPPLLGKEGINVYKTTSDSRTGGPGTDIPPGSNVYQTESGRIVIETPSNIGDKASQKTELKDGLVFDKETGETLTQVEEGTVSGIQDAPKSEVVTPEQVIEFPATEAEIDVRELTTDQGGGPGLDRVIASLVEEGMTLEDAQTVVRASQEGGRATKDITESVETREKLLEVERAIEPDEQNPKKVEHKDKLEMPEFNEPGVAAIITNKRKVMDRIGAFKIKGFAELFSNFEKMQHLKGNLRKVVNKTIRVLNKQATLGDKISRRIMKRSTKPVRRIVDLLDTYERLPAEIADELSKTEVEAFNAMRDITKWLLERANVARKKMGLKPINDLKGYIPHWTKALATEVLNGKYVHKSGYVAELMKNVPKVIDNPTAYQRIFREINQKIQDHMESDLGKLMHGLINYDLHDIMLANPLAETWEQLRELRDTRDSNGNRVISDRAYKYIADYLNYDVLEKQITADRIFNEAKVVKTVTQMINKVLRPINREISNPAASFFGGLRKVWHAAFMPFRLRNITRNFGQRLLNLSFHRYRDLGRAQFGKQDTITHPVTGKKIKVLDYVREQDWYKITKPEDTLDDGTLLSNLTQYGMIGFKTSHVGNRYASNVEVSAISSYYDWKHRFEQSHTMSSAHYKNIVKVSKRTGIPIENLQTQEVDMMNDIRDGVAKTQWEYMAHCLPTIIRGQSGRALAAYQSWWMNYYTAFLAEGYHNLITGRTRVRSDGTGGRLLTPGARYRIFKGMGGIYGAARIAQDVFGLAMLGALWMPDPTNGLPPLLSLVVSMISLMTGFRTPEKRKRAWKDLAKTLRRMMPFSSAVREIARVGDDWTLKDYVFYTKNEEWRQIWVPVTTKSKPKKGGL